MKSMGSRAAALAAIGCLLSGTPAQGAGAVQGAGVREPADFTVWRSQTGYFYSRSLAGASTAQQWGASTDMPVVGDFDGDGKPDVAVWRPSTGYWYIIQSSNGQVVTHQWGAATDVPVVGDFDGDGKADIAVWRPSTGYWYILQSSNGQVVTHQWGAATDLPVIGDFDGDGKTDIAVWRPSTGYWYIMESSSKATVAKQFGATTDVPVAGDFDGDGKTDIAVWRESTGYWYIVQSSNGAVIAKQWGQSGDIPVPKDYDGDGKTDLAVWRPATGYWYVVESGNGATAAVQWGASTDEPANGSLEPLALTTSSSSPTYTIGGTLIGLARGATVHVLSGADNAPISANGSFTLPSAVVNGGNYSVSVGTPSSAQTCAVQNGSGTIASANVTDVVVYCTYTVSEATLDNIFTSVGAQFNVPSSNNTAPTSDDLVGTTTYNGMGSVSNSNVTVNFGGAIVSNEQNTGTYTVTTTNAIPVLGDSAGNGGGIEGVNGDAAVAVGLVSGMPSSIIIGVLPNANATTSSVNGNYTMVYLQAHLDSGDIESDEGPVTFTNGKVTGTLTINVAGTVTTGNAAKAQVTVTNGVISGQSQGAVSADGDLTIAADVHSGDDPRMVVFVPQGTDVNAATFAGVYSVAQYGGMSVTSTFGKDITLFAFGNGTYRIVFTKNAQGTLTMNNTDSGTYTVAANGTLTLTDSEGNVYNGAISADGNALGLASVTSNESPAIFVGVRQ